MASVTSAATAKGKTLAFVRGTLRMMSSIVLAAVFVSPATQALAEAEVRFKRVATQYLAVLGAPHAISGTGAETWGHWRKDPGPRGVWYKRFDNLKAAGGKAPAQWTFDPNDWWLDENGVIMEKPVFSVLPGKYVVTGDREVASVLTIHPKDENGRMRWELDGGATLYDVTHLPCRSARYRPLIVGSNCTPESVASADFPVKPGGVMPRVSGCHKQDYAVLFIIGVATSNGKAAPASATCRAGGKSYSEGRVLKRDDGSQSVCSDGTWVTRKAVAPYILKRAELKSFEDPSHQPRCNAMDAIKSRCGTKDICKLDVDVGLCKDSDVAQYTTHMEVVWRCRTDSNWNFSRIERGKNITLDCRG